MQFANPLFLFGLFSLAIPIIIHLYSFRRNKKVIFPTIRFLTQIAQQQASKSKIKHLLVLICRLLAFACIVMAFAKPFFPSKETPIENERNLVSIYIDNSFSMLLNSSEGSLQDEAIKTASLLINQYKETDKFQILTNNFEGKEQRMLTKSEALERLTTIQTNPAFRTFEEVLLRQKDALSLQQGAAIRFLISDFQKEAFNFSAIEADSSLITKLIQIKPEKTNNLSIDTCWLNTPFLRPNQEAQVLVKTSGFGLDAPAEITINLTQNGQIIAIANATVKPNIASIDTIKFIVKKGGWHDAIVSIADAPINFDDQWYLSYYVAEQMPILVLGGTNPSMYLAALAKTDPFFNINFVSINQVEVNNLSQYPVIVLSETHEISSGLATLLTKQVQQGASLWIIPSVKGGPNDLTESLGLGSFGAVNQQELGVVRFASEDPIFQEIFDKKLNNPDLPQAKQHFNWISKSQTRQLLQLANGNPLVHYQIIGNGKVYISQVPLQNDWSNLHRHAFFVPLMFRSWLLANQSIPNSLTLGKEFLIPFSTSAVVESNTLRLIHGSKYWIPNLVQSAGNTKLLIPEDLNEQGVYIIKNASTDTVLGQFAMNFDRRESNLALWTETTLLAEAKNKNMTYAQAKNADLAAKLSGIGQDPIVFKWFLLFALVFLACETLLKKIL